MEHVCDFAAVEHRKIKPSSRRHGHQSVHKAYVKPYCYKRVLRS